MPSPVTPSLSPDELLHLAMADSRGGRHGEAIVKLKQCVLQAPEAPAAYHMLAAEHAEIGMYPEAIRELRQAISLQPGSIAAHFQLGQLLMLTGDLDGANRELREVGRLEATGAWAAFSAALICLARNELEAAAKNLEEGLAREVPNPALRADMARLRDRIRVAMGQDPVKDGGEPLATVLLRKYKKPGGDGG